MQGTRTLWSSDNTTMHIVRAWKGCIIIDEVDLVGCDFRSLTLVRLTTCFTRAFKDYVQATVHAFRSWITSGSGTAVVRQTTKGSTLSNTLKGSQPGPARCLWKWRKGRKTTLSGCSSARIHMRTRIIGDSASRRRMITSILESGVLTVQQRPNR